MDGRLLRDIREEAQKRIHKAVFNDAAASKAEIDEIGARIAQKYRGAISKAPLKSEERAAFKVSNDYGGDWHGIKDVARMTIIVPTAMDCRKALQDIKDIFSPNQGRGLLQVKEVSPQLDPCGYSSTTAFVRTSNGRAGEIQINMPEIIYAKQSERSVTEVLGAKAYSLLKVKYQIEGGLGHLLYEIHRVAPASSEGQQAAAVSKKYYEYFRSGVPDLLRRQALLNELGAFEPHFTRLRLHH